MTSPINTVDTEAMQQAATWLNDASGELDKQRLQVVNTIHALGQSWSGNAANTFFAAVDQWSTQFQKNIIIDVANMSDIMRGQAPQGVVGEDTNLQTISQFFGNILNP